MDYVREYERWLTSPVLTEAERADLLRMIEEWDEGGGKNS